MVLESVLVSVVGTSSSSARAVGSIPGGRAKSPHSSRSKKQNRKQKQYCNKFNKDFKKQSTSKKILKKLFLIKNKNIWIQQGFLPLITQFWESLDTAKLKSTLICIYALLHDLVGHGSSTIVIPVGIGDTVA